MENNKNTKATKFQIFKYGFGGLGANIIVTFISSYLLFFLTNKAGMSAGIAGTLYLIVKIVDIFVYPTFGAFADRVETKWGKYRPFLLFSTPILLLFIILLFSTPSLNSIGKTFYYFIIYLLFDLTYATISVSYQSLTAVMSKDSTQRNFVVMSRELFGMVGSIVSMALALPLVKKFGDGPDAWRTLAIIYGLVVLISMYLCANGTKKHDVKLVAKERPKYKFKDQIKVITTNKPFLHLFIAFACCIFSTAIIGSVGIYYYKYVVNDQSLMTKIPFAMLPFVIAVTVLSPFLMKKFGKTKVLFTALLLTLIMPLVIFIARPFGNKLFIIAITVFGQSVYSITTVAAFSLLTDCIDYSEWKTGLNSAGLITASFSLASKVFSAVAGSVVGFILAAVGYAAAELQPQYIINTIICIFTLIPLGCSIIALISIKSFPITTDMYKKITEELKERRSKAV